MMIRKRRRTVNGVEITLLEKATSTTPLIDTTLIYSDIESRLRTYIGDELATKIPAAQETIRETIVQNSVQSLPSSITASLTVDEILGLISNSPEEGSVLTYDGQNGAIVWRQSPNLRLDTIENVMSSYQTKVESDRVQGDQFFLPFAVKWSVPPYYQWGGPGKSGIFWGDPWTDPVDNFSIKMGDDDASIGETGYTFGYVNKLAMKFSNGSEGGRGFVWTSVGNNGSLPVMSLDTNNPLAGGGNLTVKNGIYSQLGDISADNGSVWAGEQLVAAGNIDYPYDGHLRVASFDPSTGNSVISLWSDMVQAPAYDGYVLTYRHIAATPVGILKLEPPTGGGGGGGTFPSVEIDGGSFLQTDQYARIDGGSFI
jgi:hypothetical protein